MRMPMKIQFVIFVITYDPVKKSIVLDIIVLGKNHKRLITVTIMVPTKKGVGCCFSNKRVKVHFLNM